MRASGFRRKRRTYAGLKPSSVSTWHDLFSSSAKVRSPFPVSSSSEGAKQSMHSSGSITRIRSAWWMQSTGQTSTHDRSLMSMQGSAMMYVTAPSLYRRRLLGDELLDDLRTPLLECVLA